MTPEQGDRQIREAVHIFNIYNFYFKFFLNNRGKRSTPNTPFFTRIITEKAQGPGWDRLHPFEIINVNSVLISPVTQKSGGSQQ